MLPSLRILDSVSPSSGETLSRCPLALAFMLDCQFDVFRIPSEQALLGTAAHAVIEAAARGAVAAEAELQTVWDGALAREIEKAQILPLLAPIPQPRRWRRFSIIKRRTFVTAGILLGQRSTEGARRSETEVTLRDEASGLAGRLDRVEINGGGAHLIDFKSSPPRDAGMPPRYRRQLLTYAYLWHSSKGEWPANVEIRYLDGSSEGFAPDAAEATAVATMYCARRQEYNQWIQAGRAPSARPSEASCRYCDYRCVCDEYFENTMPDWGGTLAVRGRVVDVVKGAHALTLAISPNTANASRQDVRMVRELPLGLAIVPGVEVAFSHLGYGGPQGSGLATWQTRFSGAASG